MEILHIENLNFRYPKAEKDTLHNISLNIGQGDFTVICGATGCGKTTLLKLIKNELAPAGEKSGEILYNGKSTDSLSLRESACAIGFVGQNPDNQIVASIVEEDVAFGVENLGVPPQECRRRVDEAMKTVGIYEQRLKAPHKLSGGQKQRVAVAGIIAMKPECIVLDEPTAMLDPSGRAEVLETIKKLNKEEGITVVLITHYMDEAVQADRVVVMDSGRIVMDDTPRNVFAQVETVKSYGLDVPQSTELLYRLGLKPEKTVLNSDECVEYLLTALKSSK